MQHHARPLFFPALLVVVLMLAAVASGQTDCRGKVGNYAYDLTPLAQKLGAVDLQTRDSRGQTYDYRVCGVVSNNFCQTVEDLTPAVCQKDTSVPPEYHDCGNQMTARFQKLPSGSDADGFTLAYTGGQDGRATLIDFKCDPSMDPGVFSYVKEDPTKTYILEFVSKYACPIIEPTPSPSQNPAPPPHKGNTCCLYQFNSDPTMTRTLCATQCPQFFGGFALVYNWTVLPCTSDTCFFHKKK